MSKTTFTLHAVIAAGLVAWDKTFKVDKCEQAVEQTINSMKVIADNTEYSKAKAGKQLTEATRVNTVELSGNTTAVTRFFAWHVASEKAIAKVEKLGFAAPPLAECPPSHRDWLLKFTDKGGKVATAAKTRNGNSHKARNGNGSQQPANTPPTRETAPVTA